MTFSSYTVIVDDGNVYVECKPCGLHIHVSHTPYVNLELLTDAAFNHDGDCEGER